MTASTHAAWSAGVSPACWLRTAAGRRAPRYCAPLRNCFAFALLAAFHFAPRCPSEWQHAQEFDIAAPGLMKISLPVETLDAARPALEDLRLCDDAGNELPFLITRPMPSAKAVQSAKSFQVSLNPARDRHHARNRTGAAARRRDAGNAGGEFHQGRARRRFGGRPELAAARARPADFPPAFRRAPASRFISRRRVALAAAHD